MIILHEECMIRFYPKVYHSAVSREARDLPGVFSGTVVLDINKCAAFAHPCPINHGSSDWRGNARMITASYHSWCSPAVLVKGSRRNPTCPSICLSTVGVRYAGLMLDTFGMCSCALFRQQA